MNQYPYTAYNPTYTTHARNARQSNPGQSNPVFGTGILGGIGDIIRTVAGTATGFIGGLFNRPRAQ